VQMAIVYRGQEITIYRDAKPYAQYQIDQPQRFGPGSAVVLGLRHLLAGDRSCFAGTIEDARVYDLALSAEQLAALQPRQPSEPQPLAWLTFQDGKATERMGKFPDVELVGDARVVDGRLQLSGTNSYLVALPAGAAE
jgi:beta-fructofuranosidase